MLIEHSGKRPVIDSTARIAPTAVIIRGTRRHPATIGDHVLIGPGAYLSGCTVRDCAFLATGSRVFNGAMIGARAEVRINATVHLLTNLPEDATVPIGLGGGRRPDTDPATRSARRDLGDSGAAQLPEGDLRSRPAEARRDPHARDDGPLLPGALATSRRPRPVKHGRRTEHRLLTVQESRASVPLRGLQWPQRVRSVLLTSTPREYFNGRTSEGGQSMDKGQRPVIPSSCSNR
jgi:hypothetical protein